MSVRSRYKHKPYFQYGYTKKLRKKWKDSSKCINCGKFVEETKFLRCLSCRLTNRKLEKKYRKEQRMMLFEILGGVICNHCGYDKDIRALQFDHKNGGGRKDRKRFSNSTFGMIKYYIARPQEARDKLQVLCANCNAIKIHENGENKHKHL